MFTSLTSWLRPSPSRRRPRHAAPVRVEGLEDRVVPTSTPFNLLSAGPTGFVQAWSNVGLITASDSWAGVPSIVGFGGTGLGLALDADPRGVVNPAAGSSQVFANVAGTPDGTALAGLAEFEAISDPVVGLRPDGTNQAPNLVIYLNTTGVNSINVSFNVRDIDGSNRDSAQQVAVEYRIGNSGNFIAFSPPGALGYVADATTVNSNTGSIPVSVPLPAAANNQSEVQVRILTTNASGGNNEWIGIDDILVKGNIRPTVTTTGGNTAYVENDPPVRIDPDLVGPPVVLGAQVTDPDNSNFNGGSLTVTLSPAIGGQDVLSVNNQGVAAGQIGFNNVTGVVTFGGTQIGTRDATQNGLGGQPLRINLNANATPAATSALARNITYVNTSDDPSATTRVATFVVADGAGGTSAGASKNIVVTPVNDAPTAASPAGKTTFEDVPVAVSGPNAATAIQIVDPDVRSNLIQVTFSVPTTAGTLTVGTVGGGITAAQIAASGTNGTSSITISSTLTRINNTLASPAGLIFTPVANFNTDTNGINVTVAVNDQGYGLDGAQDSVFLTGQGTVQVVVTPVNDAPVIDPTPVAAPLAAASATLPFTLSAAPPGGALAVADIAKVTGALSLTGVTLTNNNAPTNTSYTLTFPTTLPAGIYAIDLGSTLGTVTPTQGSTAAKLDFTLSAAPAGGPLTISDIKGVSVTVSLSGAVLSGTGTSYMLTFPSSLPVGAYAVDLRQTPVAVTQSTASVNLPFTLSAAPAGGPLAITDVAAVFGPSGAVSLAGATLTVNSGTSYTLVFLTSKPTGAYTVYLRPATAPLTYALNSAAVDLLPNAVLSEVDFPKSADLNGGLLTVQAVAGASPDNVLRIKSEGFNPGQIGLQGAFPNTNVVFTPATGPSVIVGQITSSGTGTLPLKVLFNSANATPDVVQRVIRNITFATTGTSFDATLRAIEFNLTDGDGVMPTPDVIAAASPVTVLYKTFNSIRVIQPTQVNNPPSFVLPPPAAPVVAEDSGTQTVSGFATNVSTGLAGGPGGYEAGQAVNFIVTAGATSNPALFPVLPTLTRQGTDLTLADLAFTPAPNQFGTATFTVYAMDNGGVVTVGDDDTSDPQTFTITVSPVADTPVVTPASPTTTEDPTTPPTIAVTPSSIDDVPGSAPVVSSVTHVKITNVRGGTLTLAGGGAVPTFLTVAQAAAGLVFTPAANANDGNTSLGAFPYKFGFTAQGTTDGADTGLGGAPAVVTIAVAAVNDDPTIVNVPASSSYLVDLISPVVLPIAPAAIVADVDFPDAGFADLSGGMLTVSGATATDTLAVRTFGTVSVAGMTVSVGGLAVGTVTGGNGTTPLTVTFNTPDATPAAVQEVLRNVVFSTTAGTTPRNLSISLTDGDGSLPTPPAAATVINVTDRVTVLSLVTLDASPAVGTTTVRWRLTTDLAVSGFAPGNFALTGSQAGNATVTSVSPTSGYATTFTITATLGAGLATGTLGLNLVNDTTPALSVPVAGTLPVTGGVYNIDRTAPTATAFANDDADNLVFLGQTLTYTVSFSEDIDATTLDAGDFDNAGGAATFTVGTITETSPTSGVFTVPVTITGSGTASGINGSLQLRVKSSASITDALGNALVGPYADPVTLAVDATAPTVSSITNNTSGSPLNVIAPTGTVVFTVTFSEPMDASGFFPIDFANGATVNPAAITITNVTPSSGTSSTFQVTVQPLTPTTVGNIQLQVGPILKDVAGNLMTAAYIDPTVVTVNLPPVAVDNNYNATEDTPLVVSAALGVLANDTDPNDAVGTLTVDTTPVVAPLKGTLVLAADGSFTYTPALDANGTDGFRYRVRDPFGGSATGIAFITIAAVNDAPTFTVNVPTVTVAEDSGFSGSIPVAISLTSGGIFSYAESDALVGFTLQLVTSDPTLTFSSAPAVTLLGSGPGRSGQLRFTPAPNAFGTATYQLTLTDAGSNVLPNRNASTQTFTIVVTPVNDAPSFALAGNPPASVEDSGPQAVNGFVTSFNPGPNEGGTGQTPVYTLTVQSTTGNLTFAPGGAPAIDANGRLTYAANPDAFGTATVRVSLVDSAGAAAATTQTFVIVVLSQNDQPVANPDSALVPKDAGPTFVNVLANDTPDPDGSEFLTVVSVTQPANGTATIASGGQGVLYTPAPGFTGTDTFTYVINDGNGGPATSTVTITVRPVPAGQVLFDVVAVGTGPGGGPVVRVNSLSTGAFTSSFAAYDPSFRGGVNVAVGDVNGDGVPDVVVTPGAGGGPHVKVLDGTKLGLVLPNGEISPDAVLASFFAYDPTFTGGVKVTVADMDGDGKADIITGTGAGGGAHVKVISGARIGTGTLLNGEVNPNILLASFFAYDRSFTGGVNVAAGDVNGDGRADIITASGAGGGSHVKVFDGMDSSRALLRSFFAYLPTFTGGVNVAAGDVNGDGLADIITGAGIGGGPHIKVFDGANGGLLASFLGLSGNALGADVAYRVTSTGTPLVVVGGQTGGSQVRTYAAPNFALFNAGFDAFEPGFLGGVEVG